MKKIVTLIFLAGFVAISHYSRGQCSTPTDTVTTAVLSCQPYTWAENGVTYDASTSESALSSDGCTLHILNLTIYDNQVEVKRIFTCEPYFWSETGLTYSASGKYVSTETTDAGCTVEHQLILTVSSGYNSSTGAAGCDTYAWQEMNFPSGGMVGKAVDLDASGTILAVGDGTAGTAGEVKVYQWSDTGWAQMGTTLTAAFNPEGFGTSVSLSANGKYLAVGSPYRNPMGGFATYGQVKVFEWSGTEWVQRGSVISGIDDFDELGFSVDLSNDGNVLAAGAPSSGRVALELGEVRVYQWAGDDWKQMGDNIYKYEFLNSANNNGYSVALSGDGTRLIFGAPYSKGIIKNIPGKYFVFEWNGTQWNQIQNVQGSTDQERLGWSVALTSDGAKTAVGSPAYNSNTGKIASRYQNLTGDAAGASFGKSLAISYDAQVLAAGSPLYSSTNANVGRVQVFRDDGNGYQQIGQDIVGTTASEQLGSAVALNHGGNIMAVNGRVYYYGCTNSTQNCSASKCTGPITSTVDKSACGGYTFDGIVYHDSGTYQATFTSKDGCDSLVTLNLTIIPTSYTYNINACSSYVFNGSTLTSSGTYSAWWPGSATYSGCDSSVVIHLTIGAGSETYFQSVSTCTKSYEFNGTTLTASGTYEALFTRPGGCDSLVSLNLILAPIEVNEAVEACGSYEFDGMALTTSGNYNAAFTSSTGCDSLVNLTLTIHDSYDLAHDVNACVSYTFDGNVLTSSGTYYGAFTTSEGCDSLVTLNLNIVDSFNINQSVTACGSYIFDGNTLTSSGTYTGLFTSSLGCDSLVTLDLNITSGYSITKQITACDSYVFGGEELLVPGVYKHTFTTGSGCDSVVTLSLSLNKSYRTVLEETTCQPFDFYGQTLTSSGTYDKSFTTASGCDSLISLNLTFLDATDPQCGVAGIEKAPASFKVKVYPSPTTGNLTVDLGKVYEDITVQVSTIAGRVLQTKNQSCTGFVNLVLDAPAGPYIVTVKTEEFTYYQRITKR